MWVPDRTGPHTLHQSQSIDRIQQFAWVCTTVSKHDQNVPAGECRPRSRAKILVVQCSTNLYYRKINLYYIVPNLYYIVQNLYYIVQNLYYTQYKYVLRNYSIYGAFCTTRSTKLYYIVQILYYRYFLYYMQYNIVQNICSTKFVLRGTILYYSWQQRNVTLLTDVQVARPACTLSRIQSQYKPTQVAELQINVQRVKVT